MSLEVTDAYEALRDELLADLEAAWPVDGVLLFLHGAMVADGYEDCEGDILKRVRARIGTTIPLGAELDLHCHVTPAMLEYADVLVGYKHYPHTDTYQRLVDLLLKEGKSSEGLKFIEQSQTKKIRDEFDEMKPEMSNKEESRASEKEREMREKTRRKE